MVRGGEASNRVLIKHEGPMRGTAYENRRSWSEADSSSSATAAARIVIAQMTPLERRTFVGLGDRG